ncbi:hypothetical protein B6D60_06445 [candidate division KSB1 bacterium 4484_87]|nr:MAG: hypothetical protein B6D60_06445 [candidate division KSB1 bacterium 4484_87]
MDHNVGLWVDHGKAFIVNLKPGGEIATKIIESEVEPLIKSTGGVGTRTPYSKGGVTPEKSKLRRQHQIKEFYDQVIKQISSAQKIYLFGPGTAKKELNHEMQKIVNLSSKILAVEPADKMTEAQIIAKVRNFYKLKK